MTNFTTDIIALPVFDYSTTYGVETLLIQYWPADPGLVNVVNVTNYVGTIGSPANHGAGIFTDFNDMATYYFSSAATTVIAKLNGAAATNGSSDTFASANLVYLDTITAKAITSGDQAYDGITSRASAFPVFKDATVSGGTAVFHLTNDGLSTGTALFPNGVITDSVNATVSDATASYQMSWAFSNSNKTLTVTTNKLTTANILTGLLGQTAANSAVVKLSVWGY